MPKFYYSYSGRNLRTSVVPRDSVMLRDNNFKKGYQAKQVQIIETSPIKGIGPAMAGYIIAFTPNPKGN